MFLHVQLHLTSLLVDRRSGMREGDRDGPGIQRYAAFLLWLWLMGTGEAHRVWIGVGLVGWSGPDVSWDSSFMYLWSTSGARRDPLGKIKPVLTLFGSPNLRPAGAKTDLPPPSPPLGPKPVGFRSRPARLPSFICERF
jgi:hypothetical protein